MSLKTPSFWYRKHSAAAPLLELALSPFAGLYALGHRLNQSLKPASFKSDIPVLCVGNAVAGGSGKTPSALALMALIKEEVLAKTPYFLSRGYGGALKGPLAVDLRMSAAECGDEPLLLAREAPTVIAANRPAGAKFSQSQGADLILMDDGLQNVSLKKDLSFLVIDGAAGFGNGKLLPAGPLRSPLAETFTRSDAVILIGKDARNVTSLLPPEKPLFHASIQPIVPKSLDLKKPVIAFAGLGRPEKFYQMLSGLGADIKGWQAYPDHHDYSARDIAALEAEASEKDAQLLTTEKDAMRLKDKGLNIQTIPIRLHFDDKEALVDFLKMRLGVGV